MKCRRPRNTERRHLRKAERLRPWKVERLRLRKVERIPLWKVERFDLKALFGERTPVRALGSTRATW